MTDRGKTGFTVALCYPKSTAVTAMPPLGIGYLTAVAEKAGFPVDLFDLNRIGTTPAAFLAQAALRRWRVIGISVSTPNYEPARSLATGVRKASPESVLVIGGPHPSALIERSLKEFDVDYLIQKESEDVLVPFLKAVEQGEDPTGRLEGVYALRNNEVRGLPSGRYIDDLNTLPWPAWEKLQPDRYPPIPHQLFVRKMPVAPILTTRGCPMECSFCSTSFLFGRKVRTRNPENVIEEMRYLRDRFGIREIHFEDDNLTLNREHADRLFQALIEADLGLLFKCPNGLMTATLDQRLLHLMKRAGCYQISLGIETTAEESLDKERKFIPMDDLKRVIREAKDEGIELQGLFVVGLPYDSRESFKNTVRDAIRMKLDLAHFGVFIPLPGSQGGKLLAGCDIKTLNFFTPFINTPHISAKELKALQRWAILKFYLRPHPMMKLLSMFKWRQFFGVLNAVKKYIIGA